MGGSPSVDPVVLDLYKVAVEQVDRISGRRATANSYFLTINSGLAAFVGLLAAATDASSEDLPKPDGVALLATAGVGAILSLTWWLLLRGYRDLNRAKFEVITEIEKEHLPVRIFQREWEFLKSDESLPWVEGTLRRAGVRRARRPAAVLRRLPVARSASVDVVTYLSDVADEIMRELPPDLVPSEGAGDLMLLYAVLCRAVGQAVTAENVHDAWTAWMTARGQEHDSMVPFDELSPDVQVEDEPFVSVIRRVAARMGTAGSGPTP